MKQEFMMHRKAYVILVTGLIVGSLAFLAAWPDRSAQRLVVGVLALFYFTWGAVTHLHTTKLTRHVIYEYAAMSILAGTLLMLVTF